LREGEIDAAESAFQAISADRFHRPGELAHPEFDHVATGLRIDLAGGRNSDAVDRLGHLRSLINGNIGLLVKAGALEGAVWQAAGRRSAAAAALREALHQASPGNWVRPFIDAGPAIAELLVEADVLDTAPDLVGCIIEATPKTVTRDLIEQPLIDPLTPRELEVLDEMAAGRTNAEIGGKLFISVGTVKRHVANIFLKLGATHRTEAVAKARSLGMFG
jgi:LuxR family maltose regulon positive regulatory protein